ncbi:MAG: oligosaccharide flippase family protein [Planctomycetes bacterium]|nr:oligosaccharide flippase family protein [Planctomycetota bacterium]
MSRVLALGFYVVVARMMSSADYGTLRFALVLGTLGVIGVASISSTIARYLAKSAGEAESQSAVLSNALAILLAGTAVSILIVMPISHALSVSVWGVAVVMGGLALFHFYTGMVRGSSRVASIAMYAATGNGIQLGAVLVMYFVLDAPPVTLILLVFGSSYMFAMILHQLAATQNVTMSRSVINKASLRELAWFTAPLTTAHAAYTLLFTIDIILLRAFFDNAAVGEYAVAKTLTQLFLILPVSVYSLLMPAAARGDRRVRKMLGISLGVCLITSLLLTLTLAIYGQSIIEVTFSATYSQAAAALVPLSVGTTLYGLALIGASVWIGEGKTMNYTIAVAAGALSALLSGLVLVPSYGLAGSAYSFAIGGGACLFVVCVYAFTHMEELGKNVDGSRDMAGGLAPLPSSEHSRKANGPASHQMEAASGAAGNLAVPARTRRG